MMSPDDSVVKLIRSLKLLTGLLAVVFGLFSVFLLIVLFGKAEPDPDQAAGEKLTETKTTDIARLMPWKGPSESDLSKLTPAEQQMVRYGKELIVHTSDYLGPKGSVKHLSNGMNCENCHLDAGTKPWGNNYFAVEATYPKFRARSGKIEAQAKRVNDCFERSLNGQSLDEQSNEMRALLAYMKWLGTGVPPKQVPEGSGIYKLHALDRAADPVAGKAVYEQKCQSCHQPAGEGMLASDEMHYLFPPLWGKHSYNTGAGLYRISNLAGYVKANMPLGASYDAPQLTDGQAWDVAAFINSMPRPRKDLSKDWPNPADKPFDHPFGPYADPFSEKQHKYGPFNPIKDWQKQHKNLDAR